MKKLIAMLLAVMLVASLAACGNNAGTAGNTEAKEAVPASALEILETVWGAYAEDDKFFVYGGNMGENVVENAPGKFDVTDTDGLTYTLLVPEAEQAKIDGAASMVHGMLANNFTCGVFHVTNAADAEAFAAAMKTAVNGNQWMCGMPEKLLITVIGGEYVLVAFGLEDAIKPFNEKLNTAYPQANQICYEAIAG